MLDHRPGATHPERPERLAAVIEALEAEDALEFEPLDAPLATEADLLLAIPHEVLRKLGFKPNGRVIQRSSKGRATSASTIEYARHIAGGGQADCRDQTADTGDEGAELMRWPDSRRDEWRLAAARGVGTWGDFP